MKEEKVKLRYNLLTVLMYCIGIILLLQLFNLQIIHGKEYREKSNNRLTREVTIEAARGNFYDRTGNLLAGTKMGYTLELYKSKIDNETLNNMILSMIKILEKNGDEYTDNLPIKINPVTFSFSDEEKIKNWKVENKLDENLTAEQVIYALKEKYEISNENIEEVRKIIGIRYQITKEGYSSTKPLVIAKNISEKSVAEFNERNAEFPGVDTPNGPIRSYKGSLASHIIGYVGRIDKDELEERSDYGANDYIGKTGIEYVLEEYLRGENGTKQIDMAIDGSITGEYITKEAISGNDVVLTIDANLQSVAESALADNIEKIKTGKFAEQYDAQSGAVVVTNVKTGEILALASFPTYEPQLFVDGINNEKWEEYEENKSLLNRALRAYQPGSIFKMVTAIAGLETQTITTTQKIYDRGKYPKWGQPRCWIYTDYGTTHGNINVSEAIKHSCNYFFYDVAYKMGIDPIEKYAKYFGLGERTGIELTGEMAGTVSGKEYYEKIGKEFQPGTALSAAIGQAENEFTPVQIAKYISMLANGGKNIDITLIKDVLNQEGESIKKEEIEKFIQEKLGITEIQKEDLEIKQENLNAILEGMKSVTTETGGTAYSIFKNCNIEVGGKTGSTEAGKYTNAWFVGFAPYEEPEIAVVVFVENGGHGNYTAEVAKLVIEQYFGKNAVKLDEDVTAIPYIN